MYLTLHQTLCDWITLTSYDTNFYEYWSTKQSETAVSDNETRHPVKWQNYMGFTTKIDQGTMFTGKGIQRRKEHFAVYISGEAADGHLYAAYSFIRQGIAKCTRLDIQATIPKPEKWRQFELLKRAEERGQTKGWAESEDKDAGALETVYIGSRTSDNYTRTYLKVSLNNELLIRFEVELKRERAHATARTLAAGKATLCQYWVHSLQKTQDEPLQAIFKSVSQTVSPHSERIQVKTDKTKRERWLMETCLPALRRYAWEHDSNPNIIRKFQEALNEYYE